MSGDFWLSCGHHLLDRDAGGGLLISDDFLKAYLARPELTPPADACRAEHALHARLLAEPRQTVAPAEIAAQARSPLPIARRSTCSSSSSPTTSRKA